MLRSLLAPAADIDSAAEYYDRQTEKKGKLGKDEGSRSIFANLPILCTLCRQIHRRVVLSRVSGELQVCADSIRLIEHNNEQLPLCH